MSTINHAIHEINYMNTLATRDQWMNKIHPLVKLVLTVFYIGTVVSFSRYDLIGLAGMAIYLFISFEIAELSFKDCIWRLRIVLPLVCMVGIANPFFDRIPISIGGFQINTGVLSMLTLMMKGVFSVTASYLLIATTTIEQICYALRMLYVPNIIVTQIMLTYRYISLLLGEVNRITQAYALRAPNQKGIHFKVWGSLTGQLLLRSIDRANDVFESMTLRGYNGEFRYIGEKHHFSRKDGMYFVIWLAVFFFLRKIPIIWYIGNFVGGLFL